ncbi:MAG: glycosyltransferase family 39 protein [Bacteroidetes bacterium]|nr:glycosyltransferase family 39 protein [Bacteroidota bacterium]
MIARKINFEIFLILIAGGALLYFIFFLKLGAFQIRPWDEAIYANHAYEMWKSGNYFVPLHHGSPDMYSTKPLLPLWLQVASISVFGFSELSIRIPSAIAAVCTAIGLLIFIRRSFGNTWAWTSFIVLITSTGFIHFHSSRTGDMDALLAVFLTFSFFNFYRILIEETPARKNIFLYLLFTGLAFASKSFAALLFIPAQAILLFVYHKIIPLLKNRAFYLGLAAAFLAGVLPLLIRNMQQPGYLAHLFRFDAMRVTNVVESHREPFDFYLNNFFNWRYTLWIVLSFIGMIFMMRSGEQRIHRLGISVFACVISFLLTISLSVTKLEWYDVPLYPLLAIAAGYALSAVLQLFNFENFSPLKFHGAMMLLFFIPIYFAIKKSIANDIAPGDRKAEELSTYLFLSGNDKTDLNRWCVVQNWHDQCLDFYHNKMNEQKKELHIMTSADSLRPGDHALAAGDSIKNVIRGLFNVNEQQRYRGVVAFEIISKK